MIAADTFVQAHIDYGAVAPMIVVFGVAMAGVLVEAFVPRAKRFWIQLPLAMAGLVAALVVLVTISRHHKAITVGNTIAIDGPALMLQGTVLALSIISLLSMADPMGGHRTPDAFTPAGSSVPGSIAETAAVQRGATATEIFPLAMFAVGGMMLFPVANDLLLMFIGLEVLSLPLYIMTALARRRRLLSQEAALKYFLIGAFSSAFFIFGTALLYGFAGSLDFDAINTAIQTKGGMDSLLVPGVLLVGVGLLFKAGAAPFHTWTPDVYQGAPTPLSGFMAATVKVAAFGALLRAFYVAFEGLKWSWQPVLAIVALLTMVVGAVLSVVQTDIKRLLAYSSITHAGFVLVGLIALNKVGISGTLFYLAAYGFSIIAAFALVALVRSAGSEATHLSQWAGLGKTSPIVAGIMSFLLLAFAGIPLTSGFTAKFAVFSAAVGHGGTWLAIIGMIMSGVTAFVYFKVIVLMYFSKPADGVVVVTPTALTGIAVAVGAVVTLLLGIVPSPLFQMAQHSTLFLR